MEQAEDQEELEEKRALKEEMKRTEKELQKVLRNAPNIKLHDKSRSYYSDDYQLINEDLIVLQVVISKIMGEIMMLKGGNLTFHDVINHNKIKEPAEI